MATTEIEQQIPSCKINKTTVKKIIELLEKQLEIIPEENMKYSKPRLDVRIESSGAKVTVHDSKEFDLYDIPQNLKNIRIEFKWYHSPEMDVVIDMGLRWWEHPTIEISGSDSMWIRGLLGNLEDILKQKATKHHIFHSNTKYLIAITIASFLAFLQYGLVDPIDLFKTKDFEIFNRLIPILSTLFSSGIFTIMFFDWLFPIIEFEDVGIQQRIRKGVLGLLSAIIVAITATAIYERFLKP